mmetsp:Transcript_41042/g.114066  ORF Transcript_41042/g.114066 Transcript_41042/m.114066 type:complete len:222 (+) Transcript_41042:190-855(+)
MCSSSSSFFSWRALSRVGGFSVGEGEKLLGFRDLNSSPRSTFHRPVSWSKLMRRPFLPFKCAAPVRLWILTTAPGCTPLILGQAVFSPSGRFFSSSSFAISAFSTSGSWRSLDFSIVHSLSISSETSKLASLMAFWSPLSSSTVQRPVSSSFLSSLQSWPLRPAAAALCRPRILAARFATTSPAWAASYSFRIRTVGFISSMPPLSRILFCILLMTSSRWL